MSTLTHTATVLCLEAGCDHASCAELAHRIHKQLDTPNYTRGMSIMDAPESVEAWRAQHRTARKRSARADRLGYTFAEIDRSKFNDDLHAINTSKQERQGRPMTAGYLERHNHGALPDYPCDRHRIRTFGVLRDGHLYAYSTLYRVGDLLLVSMILGHGDHLDDGIMFLLMEGMVEAESDGGGWFFYNRHDSGRADGLVWFKERLGFRATDIELALA